MSKMQNVGHGGTHEKCFLAGFLCFKDSGPRS